MEIKETPSYIGYYLFDCEHIVPLPDVIRKKGEPIACPECRNGRLTGRRVMCPRCFVIRDISPLGKASAYAYCEECGKILNRERNTAQYWKNRGGKVPKKEDTSVCPVEPLTHRQLVSVDRSDCINRGRCLDKATQNQQRWKCLPCDKCRDYAPIVEDAADYLRTQVDSTQTALGFGRLS